MPVRVFSGAVIGLNGSIIEIEVDLTPGLHAFHLVGLADKAIAESKERLAAAIKNSGAMPPHQLNRRIIINLAPADLKKEGSLYDLPIALGYLWASEQLRNARDMGRFFFLGELALDGTLRPATGVLPLALEARARGFHTIVLPAQNSREAAWIEGINVIGVASLREAIDFIEQTLDIPPVKTEAHEKPASNPESLDFKDIRGQESAKRALEIAAAGGHHVLLSGHPGGGKTLLATALPSILPPMEFEEAIEVTKIWSVAGLLPAMTAMVGQRPFRAPHHTASGIALVGGGTFPRPGEITLAHRGVLFLDEFPEFQRDVIENLRQPLEEGHITIARAQGSVRFPARFQLIAAMNPCPCGFAGDPQKACVCAPNAVFRYKRKISGPILDRIDIHVEVAAVEYDKLVSATTESETSATVRQRVLAARQLQQARFGDAAVRANAEIRMPDIERFTLLDDPARVSLKHAAERLQLSARAYHRVLKVARTIADLEKSETTRNGHIMEALQYRPRTE